MKSLGIKIPEEPKKELKSLGISVPSVAPKKELKSLGVVNPNLNTYPEKPLKPLGIDKSLTNYQVKPAESNPPGRTKISLGDRLAQLPSSLDGFYETAAKTIDSAVNIGAKKAQEREAERAKIREAINSDTSLSVFEKERRFLEENRKVSALNTEWLDKILSKQDPTQESEFVKHLNQRQAEARQKLKEGMNPVQSVLTDAALSGADMASRAATSAITGVPFLMTTGITTGAEAAQNALSEGYSADKALAYGAGSGAITAGIESFGGIAGSWGGKLLNTSIGKSVMSKLPQKAVDYVAKVGATKFGQILGDAGSEGLEEFGEYYAQNLFENILLDKDTPTDIKEALYNAGIGSIVGGVFGGGRAIANTDIKSGLKSLGIKANEKLRPVTPVEVAQTSAEMATEPQLKSLGVKVPQQQNAELRSLGIKNPQQSESGLKSLGISVKAQEPQLKSLGVKVQDAQGTQLKSLGIKVPVAEVKRGGLNATTKTQRVQNSARRIFTSSVAQKMSIPRTIKSDFLNNSADALANEVFNTGKVSEATKAKVFDDAYSKGVVTLSEYYDQYKGLKNEIRQTKLAINPVDASSIADFGAFKKSNFGTITLSGDGVPVDVMYASLSEHHPDLFPADITHPADQLQKISEVAKGIRKVETDLNDYYGPQAADFKKYARYEFDKALDDFADEIRAIRRYEAEQAAMQLRINEIPVTAAEALAKYQGVQSARKARDKVVAQNLLTESDKLVVKQLLDGSIKEIPSDAGLNRKGIQRVYEAKKAVQDAEAPMNAYKRQVRKAIRVKMDSLIQNSEQWKDKKTGLAYQRETMERNMHDIAPKADAQNIIKEVFTPIHANEALSTKKRGEIADRVKRLNLDTNKEYIVLIPGGDPITTTESGLVQLLGEGKVTAAQIQMMGADSAKIANAVKEFRSIYDEIIGLANDALVRNGYEPVEYRKDYFPHFQDNVVDNILAKIASKAGIRISGGSLPTSIAGITDTFKPGKKWSGNFLRRTGDTTQYDALKGLDKYLDSALDAVYHTDDIQRLRALEDVIRYRFSDEGTQEAIAEVNEDPTIDEDTRKSELDKLYKKDMMGLSNFVTNLRKYTDTLAGKKSFADRDIEQKVGRCFYSAAAAFENRVAANMVGGNISSALTNFIPIFQSVGEVKPKYIMQAMQNTGKAVLEDDGFYAKSDFLTNRRGAERVYKTKQEKLLDTLNTPFQVIDQFSSETVTRAKYYQNIADGMSEADAMENANQYAANVIADRSKGALPTIFHEKNFKAKLFTMFQVEVNNQFSHYFKDIPRDLADEGKRQIAAALFKIFIATGIYGALFESVAGYDPTFNPLSLIGNYLKDTLDEDVGFKQATKNLALDTTKELPFVGNFVGGGRLPVEAAIPKNFTPEELAKTAAMLALPMGGNQIKKTLQGISAFAQGGEYFTNSNGEKQLKFAVEQNPVNAVKGALFGKWSFPEAGDYIDQGFKPLSAAQTQSLEQVKAAGIPQRKFFEIREAIKDIQGTKHTNGLTMRLSADLKKKLTIDEMTKELSKVQRGILYDAFGISRSLR